MSKKLFTRIIESGPCQAVHIASNLIQKIVEKSNDSIQDKRLTKLSKSILKYQVMHKQVDTIRQAYIANPTQITLPEDQLAKKPALQRTRPFSAKIFKRYIEPKMHKREGSKRSSRNSSIRKSFQNSRGYSTLDSHTSKPKFKTGYQKILIADKFYALPKPDEDSLDQSFFDELRRIKRKQAFLTQEKNNFLKKNGENQALFTKQNRQFMQCMSNKSYYYNPKGEAVQIEPPRGNKLVKKTKLVPSYREKHDTCRTQIQKPTQTVVEFAQKENMVRKSRAQFQIERPMVLFYKSQQCNYQIVS